MLHLNKELSFTSMCSSCPICVSLHMHNAHVHTSFLTKTGVSASLPKWENNPHLVLPGHRSIVNQTRYSKNHRVLASSGVEKIIKVCPSLQKESNGVVYACFVIFLAVYSCGATVVSTTGTACTRRGTLPLARATPQPSWTG